MHTLVLITFLLLACVALIAVGEDSEIQCIQCVSDINCHTGACRGQKYCYKRRAPYGKKGYFKVSKGCSDTGHPGCKSLETGGVECYCENEEFCNSAVMGQSSAVVVSTVGTLLAAYFM